MLENQANEFDWSLWFQWLMATTVGWLFGRFFLPNLAIITIGLGMGILQAIVLREHLANPWLWILATTVGWGIPGIILFFLNPSGLEFFNGLLIGITLGFAQWLILRTIVALSGWWIIMNVVAWTTGMAFLPGILTTGVMAGLITATTLALLLRNRIDMPVK
jgi:hypothetical protein